MKILSCDSSTKLQSCRKRTICSTACYLRKSSMQPGIQVAVVPETKCLQHCLLFTQIQHAGAAGASAWGSSLAGEMEEVTLAGGPAPGGESGLPIKGLKTQVEAAWEYQAAKKSKLDTSHKMEAALETILSSSGAMHSSSSPFLGP